MKNNKLTPLLIGLPGAGKSATARALAKRLNLRVVSTDPLFRIYRAIPLGSTEPGVKILERFLERVSLEHPAQYMAMRDAAYPDPSDKEGRSHLRDSVVFRSFGEELFRAYEIEMLRWLYEQGEFTGVIPDLSASAPLFPENRELFSLANGFFPVYLDVSPTVLHRRLEQDYMTHEQRSEAAGQAIPIRGAYEMAVRKLLDTRKPPTAVDRLNSIKEALAVQSEQDRHTRDTAYRSFCVKTVQVGATATPTDVATEIVRLLTECLLKVAC